MPWHGVAAVVVSAVIAREGAAAKQAAT